jgi:transposase
VAWASPERERPFSQSRTAPQTYKPFIRSPWHYKARHLIENFFAKLKQFRAIATQYDKRAVHFLGAIHLTASVIWLN